METEKLDIAVSPAGKTMACTYRGLIHNRNGHIRLQLRQK